MKIICAWCNEAMGASISADNSYEDLTSHSICEGCADNLDFQLGVSLSRYLESLKLPIIAYDARGKMIAANSRARKLKENSKLGKSITWKSLIYECAHARLPDGCQKNVHCSGCTIRLLTADVYVTGCEKNKIPAYFNSCSADLTKKADMLISAEKVGNTVIIRIVRP